MNNIVNGVSLPVSCDTKYVNLMNKCITYIHSYLCFYDYLALCLHVCMYYLIVSTYITMQCKDIMCY